MVINSIYSDGLSTTHHGIMLLLASVILVILGFIIMFRERSSIPSCINK